MESAGAGDDGWDFAADAAADQVRVRVAGVVDRAVTDDVHERFLHTLAVHPDGPIIVDLGELSFLDSSALRMLLTWRHLADERQRQFRLQRVQGIVARVLEMSGLDRALGVEE